MKFDAALHPIWPDFSLELTSDLEFIPGRIYHLQGPNGSGKSSFITQLLLPRLLGSSDIYTLYFEQQMHFQIQTAKAYASIFPPRSEITDEAKTVRYLLEDLQRNLASQKRPSYVVMDESHHEKMVFEFLQNSDAPFCLIFSSHDLSLPEARKIVFEPVDQSLSRIYVSPS
ncbi:MAG: hypothetical protein R6T89_00270 [Candidatus Syntrophosphaera sp.]